MYGRVYCIINLVNGKRYVGQTTFSVDQRWSGHRSSAKSDRGRGIPFHHAIRKYGEHSFSILELEACSTQEELNEAEARWIEHFGSLVPNGYNLTGGGGSFGRWHPSMFAKARATRSQPGWKEKFSAINKEIWSRPGQRERQSAICKAIPADVKARTAAAVRAANKRPERRKQFSAAVRCFWEGPKDKVIARNKKVGATIKARWQDPVWRAKALAGRKPRTMAGLLRKLAESEFVVTKEFALHQPGDEAPQLPKA